MCPLWASNRLTDWIAAFREALAGFRRPLFIVGESLGGVIGLALPYPALAIDPPLRTDNLWPAWLTIERLEDAALRRLLEPMFAPGQDFRPFSLAAAR